MPNEVIQCRFNLFDEGRKYTGHHRKYVLESAMQVCYAPETREGIRLREKLGYFGHGRRILAGKLALGETEVVKLPTGQTIIIENIPSNVTTRFEVAKDGTVEHDQEILLENEPGRTVMGLHKSRVGGFSWACAGQDGGALGSTRVSSFEGFDYVLNPGFAHNRGYVLESSVNAPTRQMILENIEKMGVKDPEKRLDNWLLSVQLYADELSKKLVERELYESSLLESIEQAKTDYQAIAQEYASYRERTERMKSERERIITECAKESVIAIPEHVQRAMIEMASAKDFYDLVAFFESAKSVRLTALPIRGIERSNESLQITPSVAEMNPPEYGTAAAGIDLDHPEWPHIRLKSL